MFIHTFLLRLAGQTQAHTEFFIFQHHVQYIQGGWNSSRGPWVDREKGVPLASFLSLWFLLTHCAPEILSPLYWHVLPDCHTHVQASRETGVTGRFQGICSGAGRPKWLATRSGTGGGYAAQRWPCAPISENRGRLEPQECFKGRHPRGRWEAIVFIQEPRQLFTLGGLVLRNDDRAASSSWSVHSVCSGGDNQKIDWPLRPGWSRTPSIPES